MLQIETILRKHPPSINLARSPGFQDCVQIVKTKFNDEAKRLLKDGFHLIIQAKLQQRRVSMVRSGTSPHSDYTYDWPGTPKEFCEALTEAFNTNFSESEIVSEILFKFEDENTISAAARFDAKTLEYDNFEDYITAASNQRKFWFSHMFGCDPVIGGVLSYPSMPIPFRPMWPSFRFGYYFGRKNDRIWMMSNGLSNPTHPSVLPNWRHDSGFGVELISSCSVGVFPEVPTIQNLIKTPHFILFDAMCGSLVSKFSNHGIAQTLPSSDTTKLDLTYNAEPESPPRPLAPKTPFLISSAPELEYGIWLPNDNTIQPVYVNFIGAPKGHLPKQLNYDDSTSKPIFEWIEDYVSALKEGAVIDEKNHKRLRLYCALEIASQRDVPIRFSEHIRKLSLTPWGSGLKTAKLMNDNAPHHVDIDDSFSDISSVANFKNLEALDLRGTSVVDLKPILKLKRLKKLLLTNTPTSDLNQINSIENLSELYIGQSKVSNLDGITALKQLHTLSLTGTSIKDISVLAQLDSLRDLTLWDMRSLNFEQVSKLTHLRKLNLARTDVKDLSILETLENIEELCFWGNPISSLAPLKDLKKLKVVNARETDVIDWSPVSHVEKVIGRPDDLGTD